MSNGLNFGVELLFAECSTVHKGRSEPLEAAVLPTPTTQPTANPPEPTPPRATSPDGDLATPALPGRALAALAADGQVAFYRLRADGTARRIDYLTGLARDGAEWFAYRIEEGDSVASVAAEAGVSRATVRRALAGLALVDEVEDGDLDDTYVVGATVIELAHDQAEEAGE